MSRFVCLRAAFIVTGQAFRNEYEYRTAAISLLLFKPILKVLERIRCRFYASTCKENKY